jgi:hypothetical protein
MFYEFKQNNTGGSFDVDDKLCNRLFIEANSRTDAIFKAEELGIYFNGTQNGRDCSCCGDRWYEPDDGTDLASGYSVGVYGNQPNAEDVWNERYSKFQISELPCWEDTYSLRRYVGKIKFKDIEEYAQYLADDYGWTSPDCRIFYLSGEVKEIFSAKSKR